MTAARQQGFDQRGFRQALGAFPTGVCVVTCSLDGELFGMTMNSFNSLSLEPPLVLFSVDRRSASLARWAQAPGYAVHVLAANQADVSNRFAKPGSNKWQGTSHRAGLFGAPILPGAAAVFECAAFARHAGGDHTLFIAEVMAFRLSPDRQPLVFGRGRYATLQPTSLPAPLWPLDIHY